MAGAWYVATVKLSQYQGFVGRTAEWHLNNQGFTTYLPIVERVVVRRNRKTNIPTPYFPGYICVWFDIEKPLWLKINSTIGVGRLLPKSQPIPTPLPPGFVDAVRDSLTNYNDAAKVVRMFRLHEMVQVIAGPFRDMTGEVERSDRVTTKIRLTASGWPAICKTSELVAVDEPRQRVGLGRPLVQANS